MIALNDAALARLARAAGQVPHARRRRWLHQSGLIADDLPSDRQVAEALELVLSEWSRYWI